MIESVSTIGPMRKSRETCNPVVAQLQRALLDHLAANPQISLNGISKRCAVSEPTLRRIAKGQVKTLTSVTTILDILGYITKETDVPKIIEKFPGPIADHLRATMGDPSDPQAACQYSEELNKALQDPSKYLIFKLASHKLGVAKHTVVDLFGARGKVLANELIAQNFLENRDETYFATMGTFLLSHESFVAHFKATAEFIKPEKLSQAANNNMFANFSRSIHFEAYKEILSIQRQAFRKCRKIFNAKESAGNIPFFILMAIDTLSNKSAHELKD